MFYLTTHSTHFILQLYGVGKSLMKKQYHEKVKQLCAKINMIFFFKYLNQDIKHKKVSL